MGRVNQCLSAKIIGKVMCSDAVKSPQPLLELAVVGVNVLNMVNLIYVWLLSTAKHLLICPDIQIGSIRGCSDSIFAQIAGASVPKMEQQERAYLEDKHLISNLWFEPYFQESVVYVLLCTFETLCWWRGGSYTYKGRFLNKSVTRHRVAVN